MKVSGNVESGPRKSSLNLGDVLDSRGIKQGALEATV